MEPAQPPATPPDPGAAAPHLAGAHAMRFYLAATELGAGTHDELAPALHLMRHACCLAVWAALPPHQRPSAVPSPEDTATLLARPELGPALAPVALGDLQTAADVLRMEATPLGMASPAPSAGGFLSLGSVTAALLHGQHSAPLLGITPRRARILALGATAFLLFGSILWATNRRTNVAAGCQATTSSFLAPYQTSLAAPGAVDGNMNTMGFHTNEEEEPWLRIELKQPATISKIIVHNRLEGHTGRAAPLVVEGTEDGTTFKQLARREHDFGVWISEFPETRVTAVRLRAARRTYLHLNEVELF